MASIPWDERSRWETGKEHARDATRRTWDGGWDHDVRCKSYHTCRNRRMDGWMPRQRRRTTEKKEGSTSQPDAHPRSDGEPCHFHRRTEASS